MEEISMTVYKFSLHDKEVFMMISSEYLQLYKNFFNDLNQFRTFNEAKTNLISEFRKMKNLIGLNDDFVFDNFLNQRGIISKTEELHIVYMRDNKIDNIFK